MTNSEKLSQHGFAGDFTAFSKGVVEDVLRIFATAIPHGFLRFCEGGVVDGHDRFFMGEPHVAVEGQSTRVTSCEGGFGP